MWFLRIHNMKAKIRRILLEASLIIADVLFTLAIHSIRLETLTDFGYELTMTFGHPERLSIHSIYLFNAAILSILFGWLSDSVAGRLYITVFGLFSALTSSVFNILSMSFISEVFLLFYISTSGVRNTFLLDQKNDSLFIFLIIFFRCSVYCVFPILGIYGIFFDKFMSILCFFYLILLVVFVPRLYLEATYVGIWGKCVKCFVLASVRRAQVKRRRTLALRAASQSSSKISVTSLKRQISVFHKEYLDIDPNETMDEPPVTKKCFGYKAITEDKTKKTPVKSQTPEISDWLEYARPVCTRYLVHQTRKTISVFSFILSPICFTFCTFTILNITEYQSKLVIWTKKEVEFINDYKRFIDLFCLIVFQVVNRLKKIHFIFLGYIFLLLSTLATLAVQVGLSYLQFLPQKGYSQLRIFNAMSTPSSVFMSWSSLNYKIEPFEHILVKDIPYDEQKLTLRVKNIIKNLNAVFTVDLVENGTVSYIIVANRLEKNSEYDPTLFTKKRNNSNAHVFMVTHYDTKVILFMIDVVFRGIHKNETAVINAANKGTVHVLKDDEYKLQMVYDPQTNIFDYGTATLEPSTLYACFIAKNASGILLKTITLEGPLMLQNYFLIIQLSFLSLANSISVSFYTLLYTESPEKLRSSIFSTVVSLNLITTALYNSFFKAPDMISVMKLITFQIVFIIIFMLFPFFLLSKNKK